MQGRAAKKNHLFFQIHFAHWARLYLHQNWSMRMPPPHRDLVLNSAMSARGIPCLTKEYSQN